MTAVTRVGQDSHIGHASPTPSPFHSTPYASGSPNVFTNGSSTVRIGDLLDAVTQQLVVRVQC